MARLVELGSRIELMPEDRFFRDISIALHKIETPDGPRAVETLQVGDQVVTRDNDLQRVRWTRSGDYPLEKAEREAKPVLIKAGALGDCLPGQDLIVTPQHRILVVGGGHLQSVFAA